jgi:hypothetical protein
MSRKLDLHLMALALMAVYGFSVDRALADARVLLEYPYL